VAVDQSSLELALIDVRCRHGVTSLAIAAMLLCLY